MVAPMRNRQAPTSIMMFFFTPSSPVFIFIYICKGLPFRQAHEVVGKCVAYAIHQGKFLPEISLEEYKQFSDLFESDLLVALKPEHCVEARKSYGGPAFSENEKQFAIGDKVLAVQQAKLEELQSKL